MKHLKPNIARYLKHFLTEYLAQRRGCSLHTVRSYRDALCSLLRHLQEKHKITPNDITTADLSAENILGFLNDLQRFRQNSDPTRNVPCRRSGHSPSTCGGKSQR